MNKETRTFQHITIGVSVFAACCWAFLLGCVLIAGLADTPDGFTYLLLFALVGMVALPAVGVMVAYKYPFGHKMKTVGAGIMGVNGVWILTVLNALWSMWFPVEDATAWDAVSSVLLVLFVTPVTLISAVAGLLMFVLSSKTG